ncbi:MAG: hypothetical protein WA667_21800 [Candidatus Nitrosopolaris sp.]
MPTEAYNKISHSSISSSEKDRVEKYESSVNSYSYEREQDGINAMISVEKFVKCLKQPIQIH